MKKIETYKPKPKTAKKLWGAREGKGGVTLYCLYCYSWIGAEDFAEILILL